jgi:type VI protein secretion system component VasF
MSAAPVAAPPASPSLAGTPARPHTKRLRMPLAAKLAVALVGLVTLVLIVNGAINLWLSYNEAKSSAISVQQE